METPNNEIEKIPEITPPSEKVVEQKDTPENPFEFEKDCLAKLDGYLNERFPKTYKEKTPETQFLNYTKGLRLARIPLTDNQKITEALTNYRKSDNREPFEFKIVSEDGQETTHTAFKKKYYPYGWGSDYSEERIFVDLPPGCPGEIHSNDFEKYLSKMEIRWFSDDKERATELLSLCAGFGQGETLFPDQIIETCKKRLKGKRILSLGDDTGSLSEVLKSFGAECVGIESDSEKVALAHTGCLTEDGKPNTDVIQGDIWDLLLDDTELVKKLGKEKFDAIISVALFNSGSGGEVPKHTSEKMMSFLKEYMARADLKFLEEAGAYYDWFTIFVLRAQRLLRERGVQIHNRVDVADESFLLARNTPGKELKELKDRYFPNQKFDYGQMGKDKRELIFSGKIKPGPKNARGFIIRR